MTCPQKSNLCTKLGSKRSLLSRWHLHCVSLLRICVLALVINAALFCRRLRCSHCGPVLTWLFTVKLFCCDTGVGLGGYCDSTRLKGCKIVSFTSGCDVRIFGIARIRISLSGSQHQSAGVEWPLSDFIGYSAFLFESDPLLLTSASHRALQIALKIACSWIELDFLIGRKLVCPMRLYRSRREHSLLRMRMFCWLATLVKG